MSSDIRLKFCNVAGTHCEGEGARRRRFWPGCFALEGEDDVGSLELLDAGELCVGEVVARPRFPPLLAWELLLSCPDIGEASEDTRVGDLEGSRAAEGDLGEGVFTGFTMQRLTCRLRLEATPKRRPQVSQTKARLKVSHGCVPSDPRKLTLFAGVDKQMLLMS